MFASVRSSALSTIKSAPLRHLSDQTRQFSVLSYDVFGNDDANAKSFIMMHGILGSKGNLRTFSRRLAKAFPEWKFIVLDHRGHGDSPSFKGPHSLQACSHDVINLLDKLDVVPEVVCGHSFGGKVALKYLSECERLERAMPHQTWVLDALPGKLAMSDMKGKESLGHVLPILRSIPVPIRCKDEFVKRLMDHGIAEGQALWMTTNIRSISDSEYEWKLDFDVIDQVFDSFLGTDFVPYLEQLHRHDGMSTVQIIQAERNPLWTAERLQPLQKLHPSAVNVHVLENAGHWVHIDNPTGLFDLLSKGLKHVHSRT